jgi:hypothetical protein
LQEIHAPMVTQPSALQVRSAVKWSESCVNKLSTPR